MKKYVIIFILLSILSVFIGYVAAKSRNSNVIESLPSTEIMNTYNLKVSYSDLSRSPKTYKSKKLIVQGKVIQVIEGGNKVSLRVEIANNPDKVVFATYTTGKDYKRIIENDVVTIFGVSQGLCAYESALNTEITIPSVSVDYIVLGY